jgi:hypothetical protein
MPTSQSTEKNNRHQDARRTPTERQQDSSGMADFE